MEKRVALGKGLSALIPDEPAAAPAGGVLELDIDRLRPNDYQPRLQMDDARLGELAASIRANGIIQPILVRRDGGEYRIIAGERRWRAAQLAGLSRVPAIVKDVAGADAPQKLLELALIENIQREDLNPLEEAKGLSRLIDEFGLTHDAAAKAVGRSRSAVSNLLRLTALAPPVQEYLLGGEIEMGHARALLALPVAQQSGVAARVVSEALTVRDTERLVHGLLNPERRAARRTGRRALDADTARLENDLAERLGAVVQIEPGRQGAGRVVIRYATLEQLDGIVERLGGAQKSIA